MCLYTPFSPFLLLPFSFPVFFSSPLLSCNLRSSEDFIQIVHPTCVFAVCVKVLKDNVKVPGVRDMNVRLLYVQVSRFYKTKFAFQY